MAVRVIHAKVSGQPASTDTSLVSGTHWDADHTVTGLENVDNTSDLNKPISTATQTALDGKQPIDADLTAIAALSTTGIARRTGSNTWSLGTSVANSELATMAAYTIKGNATGSSSTPTDISISALTAKTTAVSGDYFLLSDGAASGALKKFDASLLGLTVGTTTVGSGGSGYILYDNAGTLGNRTIASVLTPGNGINITGTTNATIAIAQKAAFSAYKAANQTGIADTTYTQLTLDSTNFNTGSYFSTGTGRWTPPAGLVTMTSAATVQGTIALGNVFAITIYKNGSVFKEADFPSGTNQGGGIITIYDQANGTDYYDARVWIDVTSGTANTVASNTYFAGAWISP